MFRSELFSEQDLGIRTKSIVDMVTNKLMSLADCPANPEEAAKKILTTAGMKDKSLDGGKAAPLFFMSDSQALALAKLIIEDPNASKKKVQEALTNYPSVDVALFGRMVADDPELNVDACCQVAHAISTHGIQNEYDYFTAVDEHEKEDKDNAGAAMIGTVEYNSSTLYRYATIALHNLLELVGEQMVDAACKFTEAFVRSMPTGKQNSYANGTLPDALLVTLRTSQPVNLSGAFENPIKYGEEGYVKASVKALVTHMNKINQDWLGLPKVIYGVGSVLRESTFAPEMGQILSLPEMLSRLHDDLSEEFL
jgi:CRISPR system Cascade subunit CasC